MDDNTEGILPEGENLKAAQSLCKHCQYIFDHWEELVEDEYQARFLHCDNIFALQVSAVRGCPLCGQFLQNLTSRGELETAQNATTDLLNKGFITERSWIRIVSFQRIISSCRQGLMPADCRLLELRFRFENFEEEEEDSEEDAEYSSQRRRTGWGEDSFEEVRNRAPDDSVCKVILLPVLGTGKYGILFVLFYSSSHEDGRKFIASGIPIDSGFIFPVAGSVLVCRREQLLL